MFNNLFGLKNGVSNYGADVSFIIFFVLLTLVTVFVAVWIINLSVKNTISMTKKQTASVFGIIIAAGVVLRFIFMFLIRGHRGEYDSIAGTDGAVWHIINEGFSGYYGEVVEGKLYPLTLLIYSLFGALANIFGIGPDTIGLQIFIKMPLLLADVGCILILYKIAKKYFNDWTAIAIAGLYALCPVFMLASAVWGSLYSLVAFALLLTLYFMVEKKYLGLFIAYSCALLLAKECLYIFPVIAVFVIYNYIKAGKFHSKQNGKGNKLTFKEFFKDKDRGIVLRLPLYFVCCLIGMYLLSLPFIFKDMNANFFTWFYRFFLEALAKVTTYSFNSLSLYNIFNMNGKNFSSNLIILFVVLFAALIIALTLIFYLSKKNRANLVLLAAFVLMTLSIYFINFREMTAYPVLAILLLAFIFVKDKRILQILGVYAIVLCLNSSIVMAYGGYLNNLPESAFNANGYYGGQILSSVAGKTMNIICSVLAVLNHLYFTFVLMDISMNNNRKLFNGQETLSPAKTIIGWFK